MAKKKITDSKTIDDTGYSPEEYLQLHPRFSRIITLVLEDMVIYPGMSIPVTFTDEASKKGADIAFETGKEVFVTARKPGVTNSSAESAEGNEDTSTADKDSDTPADANEDTQTSVVLAEARARYLSDSTYPIGVLAKIFKKENTGNDYVYFLHTLNAAQRTSFVKSDDLNLARVKVLPELYPEDNDLEMPVLMVEIHNVYEPIVFSICSYTL